MNDNAFKQYRHTHIAEMRPVNLDTDRILIKSGVISISAPDTQAGSPKQGDMIARNPDNHNDQWLVNADYFAKNFEPMASNDPRIKNPHHKETSSRVSSIAASWLDTNADEIRANFNNDDYIETLADVVRTLAGSALSQDETSGQSEAKGDFFDRLKAEREELYTRMRNLGKFMSADKKSAILSDSHAKLLGRQLTLMHNLLSVLDERIADIEISRRSENTDGK